MTMRRLSGDQPPMRISVACRVDAPEMLRVVVNVLLNAFDATRPVHGRVIVRGEPAPDGHSVRPSGNADTAMR